MESYIPINQMESIIIMIIIIITTMIITITVSFHNFKSHNFKSSVSNPKIRYVDYLSVLSQLFKLPGSRPEKQTWSFENWPYWRGARGAKSNNSTYYNNNNNNHRSLIIIIIIMIVIIVRTLSSVVLRSATLWPSAFYLNLGVQGCGASGCVQQF